MEHRSLASVAYAMIPVVIVAAFLLPNALGFADAWASTKQFSSGSTWERVVALPFAMKGQAAARRDIRNGKLVLKMFGLVVNPREYSKLLEKRLGVRAEVVGGCVMSRQQRAEWIAYNSVVIAEVERRHGPNAFEELQKDVEAELRKIKR